MNALHIALEVSGLVFAALGGWKAAELTKSGAEWLRWRKQWAAHDRWFDEFKDHLEDTPDTWMDPVSGRTYETRSGPGWASFGPMVK